MCLKTRLLTTLAHIQYDALSSLCFGFLDHLAELVVWLVVFYFLNGVRGTIEGLFSQVDFTGVGGDGVERVVDGEHAVLGSEGFHAITGLNAVLEVGG